MPSNPDLILLPCRMYPNFARYETRQGGELILSLAALSDEQLEFLAEMWKQGLIAHAKKQKKLRGE